VAIGTISSPVTWVNGTVAAPSWFQNVQDTTNNVYGFKASSMSRWLGPEHASTVASGASWTVINLAPGVNVWSAANTTNELIFGGLPMLYRDASVYQQLTSVAVKLFKNSTATSTVTVRKVAALNGTATPSPTGITSATSATAGYQLLLIPSVSAVNPTDDQYISIGVTAGAVADSVVGVRLTYTNVLY
jgi:hypothetical protein